jgi:F0F1-type ATP synthase assembly protein I
MIEPGRTGAYLALFTQIGLIFLVTTLAGVGLGYLVDTRLGTLPVFAVVGLLVGFGVGSTGVWTLIRRFLEDTDR